MLDSMKKYTPVARQSSKSALSGEGAPEGEDTNQCSAGLTLPGPVLSTSCARRDGEDPDADGKDVSAESSESPESCSSGDTARRRGKRAATVPATATTCHKVR